MKVAVSVPDEVFQAGELRARQLGLSRSQLYSNALVAYLSDGSAAAVTTKLNAVYAAQYSRPDPELSRLQLKLLSNGTW